MCDERTSRGGKRKEKEGAGEVAWRSREKSMEEDQEEGEQKENRFRRLSSLLRSSSTTQCCDD